MGRSSPDSARPLLTNLVPLSRRRRHFSRPRRLRLESLVPPRLASMLGHAMEIDEAASERARASGGGGAGSGSSAGDPDRLSALPDCLLHAVMSSLKARQAVQTCVLSTRWRNLWRSVPCLDVDFDEFRTAAGASNNNNNLVWYSDDSESDLVTSESDLESDDSNDDKNAKDKEWEDFEDFSESLMQRCNIAELDSFRLSATRDSAPPFGDKQAGGWLRRAMKYCTPDPRRQCEGLSSSSWHLKRLYLCNVALDDRFANHVSSVCLSLQVLELDSCACKIHAITSHSLKSLVLKKCRWQRLSKISSPTLKSLIIDGGSNSDDCVLVIVVPAIAHLCLDVPVRRFARRISVNQSPSLPRL